MTHLKKSVRREVPNSIASRPPFVIQLEPPIRNEPAIVKIKHKGRRKWYETTVDAIFWMAVRKTADRLMEERRASRLARRGGR